MKTINSKIIIGVDPGTYHTGYGLLKISNNNLLINKNIVFISGGIIISKSKSFIIRLNKIYKSFIKILYIFRPNILVIEKTFLKNNLNTSFKLNQINGVIMLAALNYLIPIYEYNINKVKSAFFSNIKVNKNYINLFIKKIFNIKNNIKDHVTDALIIALYHIKYNNLNL